jgi:hypothetical protein
MTLFGGIAGLAVDAMARPATRVRAAAGSYINGKPMTPELQKLGAFGAAKIQDQIASNMPPPNAPSTIAQKGSSGTLIDTGRLRQSITWALDDGIGGGPAGTK